MRLAVVFCAFVGCSSSHTPAPFRACTVVGETAALAYRTLQSAEGPTRFSQVADGLYRGGQPTAHQLQLLHELGVRTVINLRQSNASEEQASAERLGMRFLHFPFSGISQPDGVLLQEIVKAIDPSAGAVYVHCKEGRDRTSLIIALYRVLKQGWSPDHAWKSEAIDFGHHGWPFMRGLERAFRGLVAVDAKQLLETGT
jgi:protein tyrosine/serine phosphatase